MQPQRQALLEAQAGLTQQQGIGAGQENEQRRIALQDQQTIQEAMRNSNGDPDQFMRPLPGKISPAAYLGLQQSITTQRQNLLKLSADQRTDLQAKHDEARGILEAAMAAKTPEAKQAVFQAGKAKLAVDAADQIQSIPDTYPGDDWAELNRNGLMLGGGLLKEAQTKAEAAEKAATAAKATADTAKTNAELPGVVAESDKKRMIAQAIKDAQTDPTKGSAAIDVALPVAVDAQANQAYKAAWSAAMSAGNIEGAAEIVKAAAAHTASMSTAVRGAKIADDVTKERLTAPIKMATSLAEAKALRQGDNPALAGVPPAGVAAAQAAAIKEDQAYGKADEVSKNIDSLLTMASAGNKAAGANVPLAGVGAINAVNGIKRINSAEIAQYGTAGSLVDKIQGKLQGWTEGKPIPQDVLDDMRALHDELGANAYTQYSTNLDALNKRTGAKFGPAYAAPDVRKTGAASALSTGHKVGDVVTVGGKKVKITKLLPGDKFEGEQQ